MTSTLSICPLNSGSNVVIFLVSVEMTFWTSTMANPIAMSIVLDEKHYMGFPLGVNLIDMIYVQCSFIPIKERREIHDKSNTAISIVN